MQRETRVVLAGGGSGHRTSTAAVLCLPPGWDCWVLARVVLFDPAPSPDLRRVNTPASPTTWDVNVSKWVGDWCAYRPHRTDNVTVRQRRPFPPVFGSPLRTSKS